MPCRAHNWLLPSRSLLLATAFVLAVFVSSCGGKNIGQQLDDLEGQISSVAGQLGKTAGLTELQLLDTLKMKVEELRVQWKDILGDSISSLDLEQQKTLDNISQATGKVQSLIDSSTKLEDLAVLDVSVLMSKVGLAPSDQIRRVVPSAQIHKDSGIYSYEITLPLFGTENKITGIRLNGLDVMGWKQDVPPHGIRLNIPADKVEPAFDDWQLQTTKLEIDLNVPQTSWKFWKSPLKETLVINTGLFPRHPLRYWFAEHPIHQEIDPDPAHLAVVNAPPTMIPGCGNSGCYLSYNVCAVAPVGSQPTGDSFNYQDSFSGWGSFAPPARVSDNTVCLTYVQHSHNQNRSVWFSAHYRPLKNVTDTQYFTLEPFVVKTPASSGIPGRTTQSADPATKAVQEHLQQQARQPSQLVTTFLGPFGISGSLQVGPPSNGSAAPVGNPTYHAPNGDTGPTPRALDFGRTYIVPVDREVNWELVVQAFTGETISLSPTALTPTDKQPKVVAAKTEPGRLRFDTTAPY